MTRPHIRRAAGAALALGTTAATVLIGASAASAADLPAPTVSSTTIAPNVRFTISGTGCVEPRLGQPYVTPAGIIISGDAGLELGDGGQAHADGTWSIVTQIGMGATNGAHQIRVTCDQYDQDIAYPPITVTVGAAPATPAAAPKPLSTGNRATYDKVTAGTPFTLGERFTASYPGFKPFEVVTLVLHSTPQNVGTFTADASGVVTVNFTIPAGTAAGSHSLTMSGNLGTAFAQALKVSSSRTLAYTGADVTTPLAIGGSLLVVGTALTVAGRRRKTGAARA
jgi:hypothetical protein